MNGEQGDLLPPQGMMVFGLAGAIGMHLILFLAFGFGAIVLVLIGEFCLTTALIGWSTWQDEISSQRWGGARR